MIISVFIIPLECSRSARGRAAVRVLRCNPLRGRQELRPKEKVPLSLPRMFLSVAYVPVVRALSFDSHASRLRASFCDA